MKKEESRKVVPVDMFTNRKCLFCISGISGERIRPKDKHGMKSNDMGVVFYLKSKQRLRTNRIKSIALKHNYQNNR